ncbi:hypothetical protein HII17_12225 [Thalassotalea sp. M1531]|uniref:Uncharacterized protein n=1 Tax=Thalassotalea algicola TaxID=2716224 RepID=A0A7Y0Q6T0_9GAMM|nr:hypothetical protein [Thalassotalea algicola]NMP32329.1 hypothetical protein [Thalassotalea algicola]
MGNSNTGVVIENEHLFRSLICAPVAIFFALLAQQWITTSGAIVMSVIFVIIALIFMLSTLSYAAYYTNERFEGKAEPLFKNNNLSKFVVFTLLTALLVPVAVNVVPSEAHMVFKVIFTLSALYVVLSALAFAAFYTNDYFAESS